MNLKIISGTDRPKSNSLKIARYVQGEYRNHGVDAEIVNLQYFPTSAVEGGKYADKPNEVEAFIRPVLESDALVIVCPEYNGGYPGILKLFIDYLPFPESLNKKPISFIGHANGAFGGLRAVEQLQHVVGYRNAHVFPERVFIPRIGKNFDEKEGITEPFQQDLLQAQIKNFIEFVENLTYEDTLES